MSRKSREANLRKRVAGYVEEVFKPVIDFQKVIQKVKPMTKEELFNVRPKFLNRRKNCYLCQRKTENLFEEYGLIKHHISYFPQVCCYVHFDCHMRIHEPDNEIKALIQYKRGDSRLFYKLMEKKNVQTA